MSEYSSRFGPRVKLYLSEFKDDENPFVSVIMRTINGLSQEQILQLEVIGAEIRTRAGDVVTLLLPARSLPVLVQKDFVRYIELTRPLYQE